MNIGRVGCGANRAKRFVLVVLPVLVCECWHKMCSIRSCMLFLASVVCCYSFPVLLLPSMLRCNAVAHHRSQRTALEAKEAELEELNKKHAKALSDVEKHYSVEVGKLSDQLKAATARARDETEGRIKAQSELTSALAGARDTAELRAQIAKLTESADRSRAEAKAATDRRVASEAALKDERMDNSRLSSELKIAQAE